MEIDNWKDFSNISFKGAEQTIETSYLTFASILSMKNKSKQKTRLGKINGETNERLSSLFRHVENFLVACKQSQGNKQELSERKNMALANHFHALFLFTSPRPFHF